MRYGYVRTSTNVQCVDRQVNELEAECDEVFVESGVSARKRKRPVFQKLMKKLKSGDTLVVLSFDRAFRSVVEGLSTLNELNEREVALESLSQHLDVTTPDGRLFFTMTIAMAEWEIGILSQRTIHGLQAAVERGATLGRPRKNVARSELERQAA